MDVIKKFKKSSFVFILLAGGNSQRFGSKKELVPLKNSSSSLSQIYQTISNNPLINHIHVVYHPYYFSHIRHQLQCVYQQLTFSPAGTTRQESVYIALSFLHSVSPDFVLVHDGARPWLSRHIIQMLCQIVPIKQAVIPCIPLVESLKKISKDSQIIEHCPRDHFVVAQTPQAFEFSTLLHAHKYAKEQNIIHTDDAAVWSSYSDHPIFIIAGESKNKKITFKEDLL